MRNSFIFDVYITNLCPTFQFFTLNDLSEFFNNKKYLSTTFFHISKVYFQIRAQMCNILFIVLNILEIKITNEDSDQSRKV